TARICRPTTCPTTACPASWNAVAIASRVGRRDVVTVPATGGSPTRCYSAEIFRTDRAETPNQTFSDPGTSRYGNPQGTAAALHSPLVTYPMVGSARCFSP